VDARGSAVWEQWPDNIAAAVWGAQTIETVKSIRRYYPSAIIVLLDASITPSLDIPGVDITHRHNGASAIVGNRGVGETFILQDFLESELFAALLPAVGIFHKLSGRYILDNRYNMRNIDASCVNAIHTPDSVARGLAKSVYETIYYTFPASYCVPFVRELIRARSELESNRVQSIENTIFVNFHNLNLMCSHGFLGISGLQAPTGKSLSI
jgi:hypothetical protein